jgi:hypothetical protein
MSNTLKQRLQEDLKAKEENLKALENTYTTIMREIQTADMVASLDNTFLVVAGEQEPPISLGEMLHCIKVTKNTIEELKCQINHMTQ